LTGKLRDETGDRLTPTHTKRHGRQLRYYVSNRLISGGPDPQGWRLPAPALEKLVAELIADHLEKLEREHRFYATPDLSSVDKTGRNVRAVTQRLRDGSPALLGKLLSQATLAPKAITLTLVRDTFGAELGLKPEDLDPAALTIEAPFTLRRRGVEAKLIAGDRKPEPDRTLLRALAQAHHWVDDLKGGKPLTRIATATPHSDSYVRTRLLCPHPRPARIFVAENSARDPRRLPANRANSGADHPQTDTAELGSAGTDIRFLRS
jgi:site-specific DNA recombinase